MNVFSVEPVTFLPTEALNLGRRPSCIKTQSISAGVRDLGAVGFCRPVPVVEAVHSVPSVGVAGTLFSCAFWVPDTGAVDKTNKEEEEPEYGLHVFGQYRYNLEQNSSISERRKITKIIFLVSFRSQIFLEGSYPDLSTFSKMGNFLYFFSAQSSMFHRPGKDLTFPSI